MSRCCAGWETKESVGAIIGQSARGYLDVMDAELLSAGLVVVAAVLFAVRRFYVREGCGKRAPGPTALPIIGSSHIVGR